MGMKVTMILALLVAAGLVVAVICVGLGIQEWLRPLVTRTLPDVLPAGPKAADKGAVKSTAPGEGSDFQGRKNQPDPTSR